MHRAPAQARALSSFLFIRAELEGRLWFFIMFRLKWMQKSVYNKYDIIKRMEMYLLYIAFHVRGEVRYGI